MLNTKQVLKKWLLKSLILVQSIFVLSKVEAYEVYNLDKGKSYDLESLQRIYFSINY